MKDIDEIVALKERIAIEYGQLADERRRWLDAGVTSGQEYEFINHARIEKAAQIQIIEEILEGDEPWDDE